MKEKVLNSNSIKYAIYCLMLVLSFYEIPRLIKNYNKEAWPNEINVMIGINISVFIILVLVIMKSKNNYIFKNPYIINIHQNAYEILAFVLYIAMLIIYRIILENKIDLVYLVIGGIVFLVFLTWEAAFLYMFFIYIGVSFMNNVDVVEYSVMVIAGIIILLILSFKLKWYARILQLITIIYLLILEDGVINYYYNNIFTLKIEREIYVKVFIIYMVYLVLSLFANHFIYNRTYKIRLQFVMRENFELVRIMKAKSLPLYYHSLEVSEICEKIAISLKLDKEICKVGGFYHDFNKLLKGKEDKYNTRKTRKKLLKKYFIPKPLIKMILEHEINFDQPKTKESALILLVDSVVTAIEKIKQKDIEHDYDKIINNVMYLRINSKILNKSNLSIKDYISIKEQLIKYYKPS